MSSHRVRKQGNLWKDNRKLSMGSIKPKMLKSQINISSCYSIHQEQARKKTKVKDWSKTSKDNVHETTLSTESKIGETIEEKRWSKIKDSACVLSMQGDRVSGGLGTKTRLKHSQKKRGRSWSLKGAWHRIISRASLGGTDAGGRGACAGPVGHPTSPQWSILSTGGAVT